jgi:hypothetical protein
MAKVIVGMHGLVNKPEESVLKEWWEASIVEGLKKNEGIGSAGFHFHMVHWAGLLYKYPLHDETNYSFDKPYNGEPYVEAALQKYDDSFLIKAKILKERTTDTRVRTPSVVKKSWMNFTDKKDPVAADVFLKGDYAANDAGVEVADNLVANDYIAPGKQKHNHHKSYGYLHTPEMSAHVANFLAS